MTSVLGISLAEAEEIYLHAVYALPLLSIPIYLIFALRGKGLTRRAFYFSLGTPGLITVALVIRMALAVPPESYILPTSYYLTISLLFFPGFWIFPVIWIVQVVLMIRGNWGELRGSSVFACVGLLIVYAWDGYAINLVPYL
jgi:hypothetical protein